MIDVMKNTLFEEEKSWCHELSSFYELVHPEPIFLGDERVFISWRNKYQSPS